MPSQYLDWDCILQCYAAYAISISRLRLYFAMLCCLRHLDISTETYFQSYAAYTILISRLRLYFAMLCCLRHLDISTETVFCNAMLLTPSWYLNWDCILQCYAANFILKSRLKLYFAMLGCLRYLYISTETALCNAMLLTPSGYFDWDCILQCYAGYAILISRLRLIFNAMLLTPSWYIDSDYILQCYAAYAISISRLRLYFAMVCCLRHLDISTQTTFCTAMLHTLSRYLDWDCILQCYAAYAILYIDSDYILQCLTAYAISISQMRLYFAMLCCLRHLDISTETVFYNAMLLTLS